jgi:hypothetical protein
MLGIGSSKVEIHRLATRLVLGMGCVVILSAMAVWAQIITSSIVGQVTDASGATAAGTEITITNTGTGRRWTTKSESSGIYTVPDLQPGVYEVSARKEGFQTFKLTGIQVLAAQSVRADILLVVGQVTQSTTVTASVPLIQTESATVGGTLSPDQLRSLPVSQQSVDKLLALLPGAQVGGSNPQTGGGTHWGAFNFTINGVQANDFGNGGAAYAYGSGGLVSLPALQSMQEFKVEAYNTNAEYRQLGTVTMVTKAGSNEIHGDAYEFNQNAALNANTFSNNSNSVDRKPGVNNQFGFNVGGPIVKNRAFIFGDYAGLRGRTYSTPQLTYPSSAMRGGDFSSVSTVLNDPLSGTPFANNAIPTSRITSQAAALLKYVPLPNMARNATGAPSGGTNYYGVVGAVTTMNQVDIRADYRISDKDQIYGVYSRNVGDPWFVYLGYPSTYGNGASYGYKTFGYSLAENHTFSPTAINDFRLAWFDHPSIRGGQNQDFDPTSLFPQLTKSPNRGLPSMTMTGYTTVYDIGKGFWNHSTDIELSDNFTMVRGAHTIKAGAQITTYKIYDPNPKASLGAFSFSGQWTGNAGWAGTGKSRSNGNAFADFLMGYADSSSTSDPTPFEKVYWSWDSEFFLQDTWQASPRLTVYYGLRYMYQTPWNWQGNYSTTYDPASNQLVLAQDSTVPVLPSFGASAATLTAYPMTTTKALGWPARYMIGDKNNWEPRFGFAYRPFGGTKTVFRAGYGVYHNSNPANVGNRTGTSNPPWSGTSAGYTTGVTGKSSTGYAPDITFSDPFPASLKTATGVAANPSIYFLQRDFKNAAVQQWNATLERQITQNWAARVTYAGSQTHHIQWYNGDINIPAVQTANVTKQSQRPRTPWASIYGTQSGASQNFNQMQVEATKRFSQGYTFQLEYQWTRSLDNVDNSGSTQNPNYPGLDYGNSTNIRRHVLVFNYTVELPFGRKRHWLSNMNPIADGLIGGWQLSGITTYQTGTPFSVSFQMPSAYSNSWWGGRADQVGSNLYKGQQSGHDVKTGVQWFNAGAFEAPQKWTWGNSSRNMMFGPGSALWDMSLQKVFTFKDRFRITLRGDFMDAFNHFNLSNPGSTIGDTRDGGSAVATAAMITGGSGNRTGQLGARLSF